MARYSPYRIYLDPVQGPLEILGPDCPNAAEHTPQPVLMLHWYEWVAEMAETHTQHWCDGCGLYAIWRPKS